MEAVRLGRSHSSGAPQADQNLGESIPVSALIWEDEI